MPFSWGIRFGGNPQITLSRIAGLPHDRSGRPVLPARIRATLSRNHDDAPVQPTRSAITVAGMSGVSATRPRTLASTAANDVGTDRRPYVGRPSDFAASITVVREMPNRRSIAACGTPSAASPLISVQSSLVITLPIVSGWSLFTGETVQFSSGVDTPSSSSRR